MISSTDVTTRIPALAAVEITSPEWAAVIADAYLQINVSRWGRKADLGAIYLVAHALTLAHPWLLPAGPVTQERQRNTGYSYGVPVVQAIEQLDTTPYGREFKRLRGQLGWRGLVL